MPVNLEGVTFLTEKEIAVSYILLLYFSNVGVKF